MKPAIQDRTLRPNAACFSVHVVPYAVPINLAPVRLRPGYVSQGGGNQQGFEAQHRAGHQSIKLARRKGVPATPRHDRTKAPSYKRAEGARTTSRPLRAVGRELLLHGNTGVQSTLRVQQLCVSLVKSILDRNQERGFGVSQVYRRQLVFLSMRGCKRGKTMEVCDATSFDSQGIEMRSAGRRSTRFTPGLPGQVMSPWLPSPPDPPQRTNGRRVVLAFYRRVPLVPHDGR